jgi:positive regulator of sigma E activity
MENDDDEDVNWSEYEEPTKEDDVVHLDLKDYVALFIAALQTVLLPIVILIIFLIGFVFVLRILT